MKKKILIILSIVIVLIGIILVLTLGGKKDNNVNQSSNQVVKNEQNASIKRLMEQYTKNENKLDGSTIQNYYNANDYVYLESECNGIISMCIADFDKNNEEECIVIRAASNRNIRASLYKIQNNEIQETSSVTILYDILKDGDIANVDIFAKQIDGKISLFIESQQTYSIFSNGLEWKLLKLNVNGSYLKAEKISDFIGSSVMPEDEQAAIRNIKISGLDATSFPVSSTGQSLVNQDKDAVKICNIQRKHKADFKVSNYASSKETNINYGQTSFNSYIESDMSLQIDLNSNNNEDVLSEYEKYLGDWVWENGTNTLQLELAKQEDNVLYYMGYYPMNSNHASEELWGTWQFKTNIYNASNENKTGIAEYDFNDIEYNDDSIVINIKCNKILDNSLKQYKIPDGKYIFKKSM